MSDKWKTFARVSRFQTDQVQPDYTGGADQFKMRLAQGSKRNGWNIAADTVYTMSSSTARQPARRVLPGRRQARLPGDGGRTRATIRASGRTSGISRTWTAVRFSTSRKSTWGTTALRRGQRMVADSRGLQPSRAVQQVSPAPLDESRAAKCGSSAARPRDSAIFNFFVNANATANTTAISESEPGRPSVGELPARGARHDRLGDELERTIRADADFRHRDVRTLSAGRLPHPRQLDAQPRRALGI